MKYLALSTLLFISSASAQNQWLNASQMSDKAMETGDVLYMVGALQRCVALQSLVGALMEKRAGEQEAGQTYGMMAHRNFANAYQINSMKEKSRGAGVSTVESFVEATIDVMEEASNQYSTLITENQARDGDLIGRVIEVDLKTCTALYEGMLK
jgi:hypothetical protein